MNMNSLYGTVRINILILVVGSALMALPLSAFSQTDDVANDTTTTEEAAEVSETATTTATEADELKTDGLKPVYKLDKIILDENRNYSDFVVGPGRFELEIAPGESKTVEMTVSNRMGIDKIFSLETEDAAGTTDPDTPVALLGEATGPYTIKDYISVPQKKFVLKHGQRAIVPVTVALPANAEPGGFYGSLLTSIISEDIEPSGEGDTKPRSKVVSRIGTLFYVTTPGEISRDSNVISFATANNKKFFTKGPIELSVVMENTGSVHVSPYAELNVTNTLGENVGYTEVYPWNILPSSIRRKDITWNREFLSGRYTATLTLYKGYDDLVEEYQYTFWVIPVKETALVFISILFLVLFVRFFTSRFEFKRK